MKTTNNNGTKMANNNGTTAQLQTIELVENVKFSEIPAIYNFEKFSIFVEKKQTGATHGEKTLYFGTITNNETNETNEMAGFDITKIKKLVNCNFKRVYISNADGATIPKCKNLTDENIESMCESFAQNVNILFNKISEKICVHLRESNQAEKNKFLDAFVLVLNTATNNYRETLKAEQLKLSIEEKEKEQRRQAKQATKQAKEINTTTEEGIIQAQIIQAMMAGDFATLADLTNKLQTLQSK